FLLTLFKQSSMKSSAAPERSTRQRLPIPAVPPPVVKSSSKLLPAYSGRQLLLCLLLIAATCIAYLPIMKHPFVNYDDVDYVTGNPQVQQGLTTKTLGWAFTTTTAANWHPLTWLSHALDCQLFGLNPTGHHLTSLLIHALNVALLFFLLARVTGNSVA